MTAVVVVFVDEGVELGLELGEGGGAGLAAEPFFKGLVSQENCYGGRQPPQHLGNTGLISRASHPKWPQECQVRRWADDLPMPPEGCGGRLRAARRL